MIAKYSAEERQKIYEEWKQSGLSVRKFCQQNTIRPPTLYGWIKKFNTMGEVKTLAPPSPEVNFFPIGNLIGDQSFLEFNLPTGIKFKAHLPEDKITAILKRLLK
jgi:hypothetical protein